MTLAYTAWAGLVLELANKVPAEKRPSVDIVPGLSAVNVAASVLGAPLMHDFAVISLSDLMTPWDLIKKRADLWCTRRHGYLLIQPTQ